MKKLKIYSSENGTECQCNADIYKQKNAHVRKPFAEIFHL